MKTSYIRKTYYILTALILIVFTILAFNFTQVNAIDTILDISQTNYRPITTENVGDNIIQTVSNLNNTIENIEAELIRVQEMSIVEELNETVWTTVLLRFREKPFIEDNVIDIFSRSTKLTRTGICQNGWSQVKIDDTIGYMYSDYLTTKEPVNVESGDKGTYQMYSLSLFDQYGWSDYELDSLITLWNRESNWNPFAENKSSGAYGIPQSLPGNKMASFGSDWRTNYKTQIQWGLSYINSRYGTPTEALNHSYNTGWY